MLIRYVLILIAITMSPRAIADDSDQLCTAGGYYSGAQDHFMSGIAVHILNNRGVLGNTKCSALWHAAYEAGERFSSSGKSKLEDSSILNDVTTFSTKIYSSIAKGAGY